MTMTCDMCDQIYDSCDCHIWCHMIPYLLNQKEEKKRRKIKELE